MKAVAYGVQPSEKGILAQANHKKHDITLIANSLTKETAFYAQGKQAVIVFSGQEVPCKVLQLLASVGIKYLIHHSKTSSFSGEDAKKYGITWANIILSSYMVGVPYDALLQATDQTILLLDDWHTIESADKV